MLSTKRREIAGLQVGDRFNELFLVKAIKCGETRAGKPYLVLTVQDKSGEVSGPVWDNVEVAQQRCSPGEVVRLSGSVQSYRDNLQLRIEAIEAVAQAEVDLSLFMPATHRDRDEMAAALQELVRSVKDPFLKKLLQHFFGKGDVWEMFQVAPAAKGVHHAYIGGLLEHSLSVAQVADMLAGHYAGVDRSLLLAGALLHDIGKLEELRMDNGVIDYTVRGRLKGHLVIGSEMVAEVASKIRDFPTDTLEQLQHLILSHHGRQEYGSPTVPMTVESFMLSLLDDLDAKLNITEQLRRKMEGDEMGWTDYQRILERYLYLGGLEKLEDDSVPSISPQASRQPTLF